MNIQTTSILYNSNQYDRIRVLGKGSFGTAIVHRRRADCTLVVLKEIDLSRFRNEQDRKSIIQEARIMSRLNHNNIIKYHNAYMTDTKLIIEMEYASLGTLEAYLSYQSQPLDEYDILIIFRQIASGLSYLHSKNIIHLDLKMANIFVTNQGLVKIGDFGIAQIMQQSPEELTQQQHPKTDNYAENNCHTPDGQYCHQASEKGAKKASSTKMRRLTNNNSHQLGTLAYSSPERCLGEPIDSKSDIWSLGCILYELITSRPLFACSSLSELVLGITKVQYAPIKQNISQALRDTFEQTIARDPVDRPTAHELVCLTDKLIAHLHGYRQRTGSYSMAKQYGSRYHHGLNLSSEAAFMGGFNNHDPNLNQPSINYPHSLVYQVRLDTRHIQIERVNLPQTKRIKEICKGKSHYLVLTYDNIVYGWGSKDFGQLGACGLTSSSLSSNLADRSQAYRATRSARNSMNAYDNKKQMGNRHAAMGSSNASSLASSVQTIIASTNFSCENKNNPLNNQNTTTTSNNNNNNLPTTKPMGTHNSAVTPNQRLSKQLVMSMLKKSQPAARPLIINELNNRKIIQIAAGANFSVFLGKTGIVMTCGDGSTGCLGRGDLISCFMPSMVDALLNCDVVSVACGPRHVVAVCGDGRAFAWGKWTHGRLGIELTKLPIISSGGDLNHRRSKPINWRHNKAVDGCGDRNCDSVVNSNSGPPTTGGSNSGRSQIISGNYVVTPRAVQLPQDVFIRSAHCGDRCTILIDSNDRCWACGENRSNKLGLDIKRRFKKTIAVSHSWQACEINSLGKYKILTCTIGRNHASFITTEGKLIVCGQDIDNSHRLRGNIVGNRESHRKISAELQTTRKTTRSHTSQNSLSKLNIMRNNYHSNKYKFVKTSSYYKQLTKSLLVNDQLLEFKYEQANDLHHNHDQQQQQFSNVNELDNKYHHHHVTALPKAKINRFQRQQIDSYLKKTRAVKKMPFECVISANCNTRFTLTLTDDNRVYFWGTRSYEMSGGGVGSANSKPISTKHEGDSAQNNNDDTIKSNCDKIIEPQLVAPSSDECFIKIGSTNNSLMSNIQLLGSDQPIIQAQDPRLTAFSLADLWILDYQPSSSSGSSSSSDQITPPSGAGSVESSASSVCSSTSSDCCCCCSCSCCDDLSVNSFKAKLMDNSLNDDNELDGTPDVHLKHDAILEPQPIVSLYIPSMFNHNGCALNLVSMFCFDESKFYLIIDTTIRIQSQSQSSRSSMRSSNRLSQQLSSNRAQHQQRNQHNLQNLSIKSKLSPVSEPNISSECNSKQQREVAYPNEQIATEQEASEARGDPIVHLAKCQKDAAAAEKLEANKASNHETVNQNHQHHVDFGETDAIAIAQRVVVEEQVLMGESENEIENDNDNDNDVVATASCHERDNSISSAPTECLDHSGGGGNFATGHNNINPVDTSSSQCGMSLDEPRSFSTFAGAMSHHIIVGPSMKSMHGTGQTLEPLSFNQQSQVDESTCQFECLPQKDFLSSSLTSGRSHYLGTPARTRRRRRDRSESTNITGDDVDETSSMPSWVKNEFFHYQDATNPHYQLMNDLQSSIASESSQETAAEAPAAAAAVGQEDELWSRCLSGDESDDITLANNISLPDQLRANEKSNANLNKNAASTGGESTLQSTRSPSLVDDEETLINNANNPMITIAMITRDGSVQGRHMASASQSELTISSSGALSDSRDYPKSVQTECPNESFPAQMLADVPKSPAPRRAALNDSHQNPKQISLSQPDVSCRDQDKHFNRLCTTTPNETRRSSLIDAGCNSVIRRRKRGRSDAKMRMQATNCDVNCGGVSNILDCCVYKSANRYGRSAMSSRNSCQSLAHISTLSSRCGSVHPLVGPETGLAIGTDHQCQRRRRRQQQHPISDHEPKRSVAMLANSFTNMDINLDVNRAASPMPSGTTITICNKTNHDMTPRSFKHAHDNDDDDVRHTNGCAKQATTLTRSVSRLHDYYYHHRHQKYDLATAKSQCRRDAKSASCSSINSIRKSLIKLFC